MTESSREKPLLDGAGRPFGPDGIGGRVNLDKLLQNVVSQIPIGVGTRLWKNGNGAEQNGGGKHGSTIGREIATARDHRSASSSEFTAAMKSWRA